MGAQASGRIETMFNSLGHVSPSHLLDRSLFNFLAMQATGNPVLEDDPAFDDEQITSTVIPLRRVDAA